MKFDVLRMSLNRLAVNCGHVFGTSCRFQRDSRPQVGLQKSLAIGGKSQFLLALLMVNVSQQRVVMISAGVTLDILPDHLAGPIEFSLKVEHFPKVVALTVFWIQSTDDLTFPIRIVVPSLKDKRDGQAHVKVDRFWG